ncbi:hypothetical protein EI555_013990, partial [Monodon monoceros]
DQPGSLSKSPKVQESPPKDSETAPTVRGPSERPLPRPRLRPVLTPPGGPRRGPAASQGRVLRRRRRRRLLRSPMSVGPSSPLPGAQGPGPGGRAAPPPRRLTGRPWPLPLPSRPVAASSSSPHPARAQSARRPRAPPPAPHSSPPLPGGGCGASPERARVPRPEDGWMERARTRACARAPLSPLSSRGREAKRERAPTSSSSSSRPSSTPRPRPPFLFLLSLSRAQRLLAPARRARARASAPRPQLGSICSRGRGPGGEEGRHAAVQSTGGQGRGRGDGRGLREPPRPIAVSPRPGRPNRMAVGGAAFKIPHLLAFPASGTHAGPPPTPPLLSTACQSVARPLLRPSSTYSPVCAHIRALSQSLFWSKGPFPAAV